MEDAAMIEIYIHDPAELREYVDRIADLFGYREVDWCELTSDSHPNDLMTYGPCAKKPLPLE
jgi:hypothetical protein